ncbi:hypothetical protein [Telmatospirillum sp. J64-1]|uniref:hypothetical protein n=1 Tax=Telmatospirillum sp. J64-1 TaxID=2502183 RepID=UPI00115DA208|nr:hypothetical protein [Telmatospirillum sp. J64-1]
MTALLPTENPQQKQTESFARAVEELFTRAFQIAKGAVLGLGALILAALNGLSNVSDSQGFAIFFLATIQIAAQCLAASLITMGFAIVIRPWMLNMIRKEWPSPNKIMKVCVIALVALVTTITAAPLYIPIYAFRAVLLNFEGITTDTICSIPASGTNASAASSYAEKCPQPPEEQP